MRRLYIIIKKSKKILQKQVGLYYHSIIVFDDELSRNSKQKSGLRCWKSLFKVRINVPLIKNFFEKAVDNSIGCVIIYLQTEHLFFVGLVLLLKKSGVVWVNVGRENARRSLPSFDCPNPVCDCKRILFAPSSETKNQSSLVLLQRETDFGEVDFVLICPKCKQKIGVVCSKKHSNALA